LTLTLWFAAISRDLDAEVLQSAFDCARVPQIHAAVKRCGSYGAGVQSVVKSLESSDSGEGS